MYRTIRFRLFVTLALNLALLIALGGSAIVLIGRIQEQARVIDQDMSHHLCGHGEKMGAVLPLDSLLID